MLVIKKSRSLGGFRTAYLQLQGSLYPSDSCLKGQVVQCIPGKISVSDERITLNLFWRTYIYIWASPENPMKAFYIKRPRMA